jgi:hypothetical protein
VRLPLLVATVLSVPTIASSPPSAGGEYCVAPKAAPTSLPAGSTYQNDGAPPAKYHGGGTVTVTFMSPERVARVCDAPDPPTCGYVTLACAPKGHRIIAPDPCGPEFAGETFARLMCHENAHASFGWPASHGP